MTVEKVGAIGVWTGLMVTSGALLLNVFGHQPTNLVMLSIQGLLLSANALLGWRAHAMAADDIARHGRLVAERLMAETMLRKLAAAELAEFTVTDEDAGASKH